MREVENGEFRMKNGELEEDFIPIAALNQYRYCAHRCWRMFCAGEFEENQFTIEGTSLHDRVHSVGEGVRDEVYQVRDRKSVV